MRKPVLLIQLFRWRGTRRLVSWGWREDGVRALDSVMDVFSLQLLLKLSDEDLGWVLPLSVVLNIFEFFPQRNVARKEGKWKDVERRSRAGRGGQLCSPRALPRAGRLREVWSGPQMNVTSLA